ncbi:DegT/DnrJ/EryC1/StrS family aminotransferase [Devosia rhodophyticola]|uniref:DegT/DnrJ/EryC1/StrS family aminotransferase n=1 Tax=Devosia rhodophyticola TaxID=3026423 RepID=A0ABY7Z1E3_9HYPH|nr:DegT/DnrJ/EryC1/StrS family aminotransferase [Devosia rhodophyticola]WDR07279.1 DegT/DnrJ/EryC1/StrS family aminotransferase [Devosia rhodophyticola]
MTENIPFIDLKTQYAELKQSIDGRIQTVLDHGQYIMGPEVKEMEVKLAAYVGVRHCVSVSSGTEALLIALMALGVGPGDEVITSPFTFAATAEVIALVGATPVFVDIEPDTFNINCDLVEQAITSKTKAIIPVSLYGQTADMQALETISIQYGIPIVEDAAQSLGATHDGRRSGGLSSFGCVSFFPSKPLGCYGDGGALFTDSDELAKIAREIRVHGQERRYIHKRIGVGGRMDTLQCAVVLAKLERFDWEVERRNFMGQRYLDLLKSNLSIGLATVRPQNTCVWAQFTVRVDRRQAVVDALKAHGIPTAVHYPIPLHKQEAYSAISRVASSLAEAERAANTVFSLPLHPYLAEETQNFIARSLIDAVAEG